MTITICSKIHCRWVIAITIRARSSILTLIFRRALPQNISDNSFRDCHLLILLFAY